MPTPPGTSPSHPEESHPRVEAAHVLRSLANPLLVVDRSWRVLAVNPATEALIGLPASEAVGRLAWDLFPGVIDTPFATRFRESMTAQRPEQSDAFYRLRERWFAVQSHPTGDGLVITFENITERKRAERRAELMCGAAALIGGAADLREGLAGIMRLLREMGDFDLGEVWLAESGLQRLRVIATEHAETDGSLAAFTAHGAELEFSSTDGLPAIVWESREPVFLDDLSREQKFVRRETAERAGLRSAALVPIRSLDRTIGVIGLYSRWPSGHDDTHAMLTGVPEALAPLVELKRGAAELDRLFNLTTDLACLANLDGWFVRVNAAFERVLGYTAEELTSRPYADYVHPDDRDVTAERTEDLGQGTEVRQFENRYRTKSGEWRWLNWTALSVVEEGLIYAFARDVTEEKRQRERERLRREFFAGLATGAPLADTLAMLLRGLESDILGSRGSVLLLDADGRLQTASAPRLPSAYSAEVNGLVPGPESGSCGAAVHTRQPVITANIATDPRWALYTPIAAKYRLQACWSVPFFARDGRVLGSIALYFDAIRSATPRDLSDLEQVARLAAIAVEHQRTTEELQLLHQAVSRLNDVVMITEASPLDEPGPRIEFVNDSFERLTGFTRAEVLGRTPRLLQGSDTDRAVLDRIRQALEAGQPVREELLNYTREGRDYWVELDITPVVGPDGAVRHFVAIERDVSERRHLQEQLLQSQKMEAVGRLAGGVAHDFNNMLTAILGFSAILLDTGPQEAIWRDEVEQIQLAATRAAELTRQLLAFSRKQVMQPVILDLNTMVTDTRRMLRRLVGEHVTLRTTLMAEPATVRVDPAKLEQAIVNLAVNARDAMPHGGTLSLSTALVTLDGEYAASRPGVVPGRHVMLAVTDTGVGMSRDVLEHAFEPFFTTKPRGRGTGLGLSSVYGIVTQAGGHLFAYSEPDKGSTFKLYFPFIEAPAHALSAEPADEKDPGGTETVLVVEDEEVVRQLVVRILERLGYRVLSAAAGDEALTLLDTRQEPVDLLVTDVVMPRMTGEELARRLQAERPDLKVLFISGYTEDTIVHHGVLDPGVDLLEKPFTHESLARKVREVLDR